MTEDQKMEVNRLVNNAIEAERAAEDAAADELAAKRSLARALDDLKREHKIPANHVYDSFSMAFRAPDDVG